MQVEEAQWEYRPLRLIVKTFKIHKTSSKPLARGTVRKPLHSNPNDVSPLYERVDRTGRVRKCYRRVLGYISTRYRTWIPLAFRVRNILRRSSFVAVNVDGIAFKLRPKGEIACGAWSGRGFERCELAFTLGVIDPAMTFFDVGANVGLFSLAVGGKYRGCGVRIYGFEPCKQTFKIFQDNIHLNGLTNVSAVRTALSDRIGQGILQLNSDFRDGLNTLGNPSHPASRVVGVESVPLTTIDDFVATNRIERVDVMKVDVEGAELSVFNGARGLLSRQDGPLILYESYGWCTAQFGYHPVEIIWLLREYGYELFTINRRDTSLCHRSAHTYDAIFVAMKTGDSRFAHLLH